MMHTKNNLPEETRKKVVDFLQDRLADAIDLMLQSKQAHWNVRGPHFMELHELFDRAHEESENYVDLIAERIMQLGGTAEGTSKVVTDRSSLPEYPLGAIEGRDHVEALSNSFAEFGKLVHLGIDEVSKRGDAVSGDILTEVSRNVDQTLWFIESHASREKRNVPREQNHWVA